MIEENNSVMSCAPTNTKRQTTNSICYKKKEERNEGSVIPSLYCRSEGGF